MGMPEHCSQESFSIDAVQDGGQFEATLLWENIVNHLETSMKCGRHTRALRSFANCFHGSAAVDSLLAYLCIIMAKNIKREQVQILCQKLLSTGVMEDVRNKEKDAFRESRLYRLTRNHFWSVSSINSSNQDPMEENELSRAKSAEDLCVKKEDDTCFQDDLKGYASDSTISCSANRHLAVHIDKKKRNSSRKKQPPSASDPTLKKDAGFFQFMGTKLSISSSLIRMTSSRCIFKGSDNALSSFPGESNESLTPPDQQKRKMSACRRPLRGPLPASMEENVGHPISSNRGSLDSMRKNSKSFAPKRRWSAEKVKDNGKVFPPASMEENVGHFISSKRGSFDRKRENSKGSTSTRRLSIDKVKDDGNFFPPLITVERVSKGISLTSGRRMSFDRLREDNRGPSLNATRRSVERVRDDCRGHTLLAARRGSIDRMREDNSRGFALLSARRGSIDHGVRKDSEGPSSITARRGSVDSGDVLFCSSRPLGHTRRRRNSRDDLIHSKLSGKERLEDNSVPGHHKPSLNTLKKHSKKTTVSKQDKVCKRKTLNRSHSFSSVEDYMAGPRDDRTGCSDARNPHLPLTRHSDKWIVYGFV